MQLNKPLRDLIGLRVTKAEVVQDYLHLTFGEVAHLSIANDYALTGEQSFAALENQTVSNASQDSGQVVLAFENGITLNISLRPEAYHGPEAIVLRRQGHPIVVWN